MVNKNFTIVRGNSLQFRINFINAETLPDQIYFIAKDKYNDSTAIFELSVNNGIYKVDDEDSYDVFIPADDTEELQLLNYIYQISVVYGSDYDTIVEGKLIITPEL